MDEKGLKEVGFEDGASALEIRTYVENGYGNFIDPEKLKRHGYGEYVRYVPKQWAHTLAYSRSHCAPEPYGKNCQVYIERASKPLQTAFAEDLARNPDKTARLGRLQELYDEAVAEVNEKMLGRIPEDVMAFRRKVTIVVLAVMVATFLGLGLAMGRIPDSMINLPNKDYWLAPERRQQSLDTIQSYLLWMGSLTIIFLTDVFHQSYQVGLGKATRLGHFWIGLAVYLALTAAWCAGLFMAFRRPTPPQES